MDIDPHTLQQILTRIEQQMRCPQCGKRVPVDFSAVRVMSDNAMLLQVKCDACNAFIVLHASLQGVEHIASSYREGETTINASSTLQMSEEEMGMLHTALKQCDGSFETLFNAYGSKEATETADSDIA